MHASRSITVLSNLLALVLMVLLPISAVIAATAPAPLIATGYFVDCQSGNDANAGTSSATPWKTVAKVNNSIAAPGVDLWFKSGTICAEPLLVDWSGTAGNHVVIGSYYVSGGTAYQLTPDNPTAFPTDYTWSRGNRAALRGTYNSGCSASLRGSGTTTCAFNNSSAVPREQYTAMIELKCDYCDVQSLSINDSAGRGMYIGEFTATNEFVTNNHRIVDNDIGPTAGSPFSIQQSHHDYISGNYIHDGTVATPRGDNMPGADPSAPLIGTFSYTPLGSVMENSDILFEKNALIRQWGEALIVSDVGTVIVRGNRISGTGAVGLYTQACLNCVYEYNLIYGGNPTDHSAPMNYGIGIVAEAAFSPYHESDIIIRGNIVAHSTNCIIINPESEAAAAGVKISVRAYNNSCINMRNGISIGADGMTSANVGANGIRFRNNIAYNESGAKTLCTSPTLANVDFDYNLWGSTPIDPDCRGAHDPAPGNPLLMGANFSTKTIYTTPPTMVDFVLRSESPARGRGTPLTSTALSAAAFPIAVNVAYPCATFDLRGSSIDAVCADRGATSPNLGALAGEGILSSSYVLTID